MACTRKEHDKDRKRKHQDKPKLCDERHHVEAPAGMVCQGGQKVNQNARPDRQRGQGSQHICQRQDQRNNQRAQLQYARNEQL
eukprot:15342920-Ditylum_brightwellii.AAC.1